jgi:hypothetical protein
MVIDAIDTDFWLQASNLGNSRRKGHDTSIRTLVFRLMLDTDLAQVPTSGIATSGKAHETISFKLSILKEGLNGTFSDWLNFYATSMTLVIAAGPMLGHILHKMQLSTEP